jgi:galactosamine-6-phosphate isomerase
MRAGHPASGLKFLVTRDYETLSQRAAQAVMAELKHNPRLLLCASAGGTPTGAYQLLGIHCRRQPKLFKRLRVVQIDEWAGLPRSSPATCESDLQAKLLGLLEIGRNRFRAFRSDAAEPEQECDRMVRWVQVHGPIDLCILGLGTNGHVAMNEPGPALVPHAHVVRLAASSRRHALLRHLSKKPSHGMTLGMGEILCSRKILLLVSGEGKRSALEKLAKSNVTTRFPASLLWLHPDATVLCDRAAAGRNA